MQQLHPTASTRPFSTLSHVLQVGFAPDDVNSIIKESIDAVLQNQQYSEVKVSLPGMYQLGWRVCSLSACRVHFNSLKTFE